jgi:hypothetical protein
MPSRTSGPFVSGTSPYSTTCRWLPRVEEVQASARKYLRILHLPEGLPQDLTVIHDHPDVAAAIPVLRSGLREGYEPVGSVYKGHARAAAAQPEIEEPTVELQRLVDVDNLNCHVVEADGPGTAHVLPR